MRVGLNSYHFSEYATWDVSIIFPWTDLILKMTDFSNPLHPFRPYYCWPSTSKPHQLIHPKVRIISSFFSHMCVLSKRGVFQEIFRYWKLYEQFWAETCSLYWERKLNGKCIFTKDSNAGEDLVLSLSFSGTLWNPLRKHIYSKFSVQSNELLPIFSSQVNLFSKLLYRKDNLFPRKYWRDILQVMV